MAASSKAQFLSEVHAVLKKRYTLEPSPERLPILEAVVYGICHEGVTREQANQALSRFKDDFFDWNEVRVSSIEEIQDALSGLPEAESRAYRVRRFLRQMFEKTYGFTLEALTKKPQKEASKSLEEYEALSSDYVMATVVLEGLGGHAIPVDGPTLRGLTRLGVAEEQSTTEDVRSSLERAVPKNRGHEFADLMEELTHDTCIAGPPDCPRCDLRKMCPTGLTRLVDLRHTAKSSPAHSAPASASAPATPNKAASSRGKIQAPPTPPPPPETKASKPPVPPPTTRPKPPRPK